MNPDEQAMRAQAFRALLARYCVDETEYDEGEEEDPRVYLSGEEPIRRWVCVTSNTSSRGYWHPFFLPTFDTADAAMARAEEYMRDDLFEEMPEAVFDLDTGTEYRVKGFRVEWELKEVAPTA